MNRITACRYTTRCLLFAILLGCFALPRVYASTQEKPTAESVSHYTMGLVLDWYGLNEEALDQFKRAVRHDSGSYAIHLKLGADYARLGKFDDAIKELNIAKGIQPDNLHSYYLLALVYSAQQDLDKAALEYEAILKNFNKSDPQNIEVYAYLGQLYFAQKRFKDSIRQFEAILELDPKNVDVIFLIGNLYLEMGQKKKAIEYLKKAIGINPNHQNSLNSLGYIYAEDGVHLDEAQTLIEKALELEPDNGAYLDSLGWVYYQKGSYEKALEYLKQASELYTDPVIFEHLGDTYFKTEKWDDAKKAWEKSLELAPKQEKIIQKLNILKKDKAVR